MFDVLILNGVVVDGTGAHGYRADVGVVGERIDAIGNLARAQTRRVVNAAGLTVAPGFIDTHTHSEGDLLVNPQHACGLNSPEHRRLWLSLHHPSLALEVRSLARTRVVPGESSMSAALLTRPICPGCVVRGHAPP